MVWFGFCRNSQPETPPTTTTIENEKTKVIAHTWWTIIIMHSSSRLCVCISFAWISLRTKAPSASSVSTTAPSVIGQQTGAEAEAAADRQTDRDIVKPSCDDGNGLDEIGRYGWHSRRRGEGEVNIYLILLTFTQKAAESERDSGVSLKGRATTQ